jgi:hypothetical protein
VLHGVSKLIKLHLSAYQETIANSGIKEILAEVCLLRRGVHESCSVCMRKCNSDSHSLCHLSVLCCVSYKCD